MSADAGARLIERRLTEGAATAFATACRAWDRLDRGPYARHWVAASREDRCVGIAAASIRSIRAADARLVGCRHAERCPRCPRRPCSGHRRLSVWFLTPREGCMADGSFPVWMLEAQDYDGGGIACGLPLWQAPPGADWRMQTARDCVKSPTRAT